MLGTLCLLDRQPRPFTSFDLELLSVLAKRVAAELECREKRLSPRTPDAAFRYLSWLDDVPRRRREGHRRGPELRALT